MMSLQGVHVITFDHLLNRAKKSLEALQAGIDNDDEASCDEDVKFSDEQPF